MDQTIDTTTTVTAIDSPDYYINRELSWRKILAIHYWSV
jgi:hypothetical protein